MSVRIRNTSREQAPPAPPARPDGTPYQYELVTAAWRGYDDTLAGLAGLLIDGYDDLDGDERLAARLRYAVDAQVRIQSAFAAECDLGALSAADREILLGPRDTPPAITEWRAPVPLVLVTSYYQPDGDLPRPREEGDGEIAWIDPGDDESLLRTLHDTGWITLNTAQPEEA